MPFYEIIYETGNRSVVSGDSDKEVLAGAKAHHERAVKGLSGRGSSTPRSDLSPGEPGYNAQVMDYPAERIVRILRYDEHPGDQNQDMTMSKDVLESEIKNILKSAPDVVALHEVAAQIRELANPHVPLDQMEKHSSQYKMQEDKELELDFV